jgi:hypothetical protein
MHRRTIIVLIVALAALLLIAAVANASRAPSNTSSVPAGQLISVVAVSVRNSRCATDTCSGLDLKFADGGHVTIAAPGDARSSWTMIDQVAASREDQDYAALLAQAIGTRDPAALAQALSQALRH